MGGPAPGQAPGGGLPQPDPQVHAPAQVRHRTEVLEGGKRIETRTGNERRPRPQPSRPPPDYVFKTDTDSYVNLAALAAAVPHGGDVGFVGGEARASNAVVKVSAGDPRTNTDKNECPSYMYNGSRFPKMVCGAG